jgi:hypothetical protein
MHCEVACLRCNTALVTGGFPSAEQLTASGVPSWVPRSYDDADGAYFLWNEGARAEGRLFVRPQADRQQTIERLIAELEVAGQSGDPDAPHPKDLAEPVAVLTARTWWTRNLDEARSGYGRLARPEGDLRPLDEMVLLALADLQRQRRSGDATSQ